MFLHVPQHGIAKNVFVFTCTDPERGRGSGPPSLIHVNHKNIGCLSITGPDLHINHKATMYQASVQRLAFIGPPMNRRLIGVSLDGR